MKVKAIEDCYLGVEYGGLKLKDEEFEYSGPPHDSLISLEPEKKKPVNQDNK